ncbi:hypothetical protein JKG47_03530 [Acidithiobacillus sp. MC6.1]|nr:hypothetical protein [Acidithiobacillus sp. MC6.1]
MRKVHLSMGSALPTVTPLDAMQIMAGSASEVPLLGRISVDKVQIGPQNCSRKIKIDAEMLDDLQARFPETRFRVHANVRVLDESCNFDLASMGHFLSYRAALVPVLRHLGEPYTIHAGRRRWMVPLHAQISRCKKLEDDAGVPVGIEGLYPDAMDGNTCSTWGDYEQVLRSDVRYALDLSHLNIVRAVHGEAPDGLVREMLESPNCIEVHLSGNDGMADRHLALGNVPFWWTDYREAAIHGDVFYEGRTKAQEENL